MRSNLLAEGDRERKKRRAAGGNKQNVKQGAMSTRRWGELMTRKETANRMKGGEKERKKKGTSQKFQFVIFYHFFASLGIIMISCFRNTPG